MVNLAKSKSHKSYNYRVLSFQRLTSRLSGIAPLFTIKAVSPTVSKNQDLWGIRSLSGKRLSVGNPYFNQEVDRSKSEIIEAKKGRDRGLAVAVFQAVMTVKARITGRDLLQL